MKICPICGRKSIIKTFVWVGNTSMLKERCCNPRCSSYKSYPFWKW